METDLDAQLYFTPGLIVVTDQRLMASTRSEALWLDWVYRPGLALVRYDQAGIGSLELLDTNSLLARWRYTLGGDTTAARLIEHFTQQLSYQINGVPPPPPAEVLCPQCHRVLDSPLLPGQEECAVCSRESHVPPPSMWILFRLWRFAKPYKWRLLAGFLLTLGSTAATLVPPYLTMPLMDNVLIPHQNGKPINSELVTFYLTGLLGAAMLAWVLGWARTYMLALVSERIGADLRTATYEHLLTLSQEYFGGKRTGDLMARTALKPIASMFLFRCICSTSLPMC
ncbi:ATP-binding cassette, subfamily B [Nitrosospira sp. Nl5]|uniref:ABC transporter transmembrane domain-containing protein n=1 Tax=Nitrosospira sp. Nl5 TaxID=200120 RepID=UPI00087E46F4|nr:ATP-binding cassette, subfamily B [Nitrosospira sp. Nl5]